MYKENFIFAPFLEPVRRDGSPDGTNWRFSSDEVLASSPNQSVAETTFGMEDEIL